MRLHSLRVMYDVPDNAHNKLFTLPSWEHLGIQSCCIICLIERQNRHFRCTFCSQCFALMCCLPAAILAPADRCTDLNQTLIFKWKIKYTYIQFTASKNFVIKTNLAVHDSRHSQDAENLAPKNLTKLAFFTTPHTLNT